jgi:hypothetical protein
MSIITINGTARLVYAARITIQFSPVTWERERFRRELEKRHEGKNRFFYFFGQLQNFFCSPGLFVFTSSSDASEGIGEESIAGRDWPPQSLDLTSRAFCKYHVVTLMPSIRRFQLWEAWGESENCVTWRLKSERSTQSFVYRQSQLSSSHTHEHKSSATSTPLPRPIATIFHRQFQPSLAVRQQCRD